MHAILIAMHAILETILTWHINCNLKTGVVHTYMKQWVEPGCLHSYCRAVQFYMATLCQRQPATELANQSEMTNEQCLIIQEYHSSRKNIFTSSELSFYPFLQQRLSAGDPSTHWTILLTGRDIANRNAREWMWLFGSHLTVTFTVRFYADSYGGHLTPGIN